MPNTIVSFYKILTADATQIRIGLYTTMCFIPVGYHILTNMKIPGIRDLQLIVQYKFR